MTVPLINTFRLIMWLMWLINIHCYLYNIFQGKPSWLLRQVSQDYNMLILSLCMVLEKTLESPLDCKEIQSINSEGDQPRDFFGGNDAEAETPVLWIPHAKSWLIGKDSDAGRDWGQEKGTTEDEMAGWHHGLNGRWVWVNSGSWWWTGRPSVLRFMGSQRVGRDWVTELNWTVVSEVVSHVWLFATP